MADAHADAPELRRAEGALHVAQAVVPRRAAAALHAQLAGREVELVMEGPDRVGRDLVEGGGGLHRIAAAVHVGERLEGEDPGAADHPLRDLALEALAPGGEAVARGDGVERHEADVVALPRMFLPRIAEADPEQHWRGLLRGMLARPPPSIALGA
jgi:hypothetical protein